MASLCLILCLSFLLFFDDSPLSLSFLWCLHISLSSFYYSFCSLFFGEIMIVVGRLFGSCQPNCLGRPNATGSSSGLLGAWENESLAKRKPDSTCRPRIFMDVGLFNFPTWTLSGLCLDFVWTLSHARAYELCVSHRLHLHSGDLMDLELGLCKRERDCTKSLILQPLSLMLCLSVRR